MINFVYMLPLKVLFLKLIGWIGILILYSIITVAIILPFAPNYIHLCLMMSVTLTGRNNVNGISFAVIHA